jgi:hypothetical protein
MSRNKGHGRNEQERVSGEGGKGTKAPTRKHAGKGSQKPSHRTGEHKKPDEG